MSKPTLGAHMEKDKKKDKKKKKGANFANPP